MFLISLFERCVCARRRYVLIVALAVLLDYAPTHALVVGTTLSVLFAELAERLIPFGRYIVTAVDTFFPVSS